MAALLRTPPPPAGDESTRKMAKKRRIPNSGTRMRRNSVIAACVPVALLGLFYVWVVAVWMSVGRPPSVDSVPEWLRRWEVVVGLPLILLPPLGCFSALALFRSADGEGQQLCFSCRVLWFLLL
jgi:hypothetical protein